MTLDKRQYNEVCQPQQLATPEDCLLLLSQPADADWANAACRDGLEIIQKDALHGQQAIQQGQVYVLIRLPHRHIG